MGGPPCEQFWFKDDHSPVYDYSRFDLDAPASYRRSVYRFIVRSVPDPFMDRLDCPDPSVMTPKRKTTHHGDSGSGAAEQSVHGAAGGAPRASDRGASQPMPTSRLALELPTGAGARRPTAVERRLFGSTRGKVRPGEPVPSAFQQQRVSVCGLNEWIGADLFFGISAAAGRHRAGAAAGPRRAGRNRGSRNSTAACIIPRKAKRVVQLFMSGAASQCDTFDYKPQLIQQAGEKFDPGGKVELFQSNPGAVMKSPWEWKQHGQCGQMGQRSGAAHRVLRGRHRVRAFDDGEIERARAGDVHAEHRLRAAGLSEHGRRGFPTGWAA